MLADPPCLVRLCHCVGERGRGRSEGECILKYIYWGEPEILIQVEIICERCVR